MFLLLKKIILKFSVPFPFLSLLFLTFKVVGSGQGQGDWLGLTGPGSIKEIIRTKAASGTFGYGSRTDETAGTNEAQGGAGGRIKILVTYRENNNTC